MSKEKRVHNPKAVEIVYDSAGHICTGHQSVMADLSDPVTDRLVQSNRLIVPATPRGTAPDAADHLILDGSEPVEPQDPEPATPESAPATTSTTSTRRTTNTTKSGETK